MHALEWVGLVVLLAPLAAGAASVAQRDQGGALPQLGAKRIFFGHQSVGANLLDGLAELRAGPIVQTEDSSAIRAGGLAHAYVGQNTDPRSKLRHFERVLDSGMGAQVDAAMLKFCYVDFDANTDPTALFADYRATIERLQRAFPQLTIVHVTVPLTTVQSGPKAMAKRILGRDVGLAANARRHAFNELLRRTYAGKEPLFDLAALEASRPDGIANTFDVQGLSVPALAPEYTDDGGHLNATARRRFARELLAVLGAVPARHPAEAHASP